MNILTSLWNLITDDKEWKSDDVLFKGASQQTTWEHEYLDRYKNLKQTPSGNRHGMVYEALQEWLRKDKDRAVALLLSNELDWRSKADITTFLGHGGSVALKDNSMLVPYLREVWKHKERLDLMTLEHLKWLIDVHKYPLE